MHNPIYCSAHHALCGPLRATAAWAGTLFAGARFGPVRQQQRPAELAKFVRESAMITGTELLEALPVAVYTTDAEGRITFYNRAAAELWGHHPELGSSQWCGSWRLYWPDGRPLPHGECPMAIALKEGREVRGEAAIAERPDGTRVRFMPYPTPLRDASGRLVGALNLLMDVTERHDSELESARLAAIVVSSDDAIISKTLDGRITSWNAGATRIFGYEASEMIGESILRIIPPELHGEEREILARLRRGERTVSPLRDRSGRVVGASKVGLDITDRKRAEKMQRVLTDELAHRVKNTLATGAGDRKPVAGSCQEPDRFCLELRRPYSRAGKGSHPAHQEQDA